MFELFVRNAKQHLPHSIERHMYVNLQYLQDSIGKKQICVCLTSHRVTRKCTQQEFWIHYNYVPMGAMAYQITRLMVVYSSVYSGADERKHQSSASLALCGEFTGDRWIPRTNGQLRGKCFHWMTSSWKFIIWYEYLSCNVRSWRSITKTRYIWKWTISFPEFVNDDCFILKRCSSLLNKYNVR